MVGAVGVVSVVVVGLCCWFGVVGVGGAVGGGGEDGMLKLTGRRRSLDAKRSPPHPPSPPPRSPPTPPPCTSRIVCGRVFVSGKRDLLGWLQIARLYSVVYHRQRPHLSTCFECVVCAVLCVDLS